LAVLDDFSPERAERHLRGLATEAPVIRLSARKGAGLDQWLDWLRAEVAAHRGRVARGETRRPAVQPDGERLHRAHPGGHGAAGRLAPLSRSGL
nr:hydrogenase accessory protein HypB [Gammaproteobacteria bacterium]